MNSSSILLGILPLLLFVIVDSFSGVKAAIITALIVAAAEVGYSLYAFGEVDWITGLSFLLIVVLGGISYWKKTSIHFKLQPVILSLVFAVTFLVTYYMGKPILLEMMDKYQALLPEQAQQMLEVPIFRELMAKVTHYCGYAFIAHAALTAWAAFKLNNWWWIAMRGIGFYVFMLGAMFLARLTTPV